MRGSAVVLALGLLARAAGADSALIAQGEYLVRAGGCVDCHTAEHDGATPLAGGRGLKTPFGTFFTPNLTPDPATGLGGWSLEDFTRAMRHGVAPSGEHYYPAFPYASYSGIRHEDLRAIKAYLDSLPPVRAPVREHDLVWYASLRAPLAAWKWLYFEPQAFEPDPGRSAQWNRGAYLVRHLGHCGECHTPRNAIGGQDRSRELAGNRRGPDGSTVPNITPLRNGGVGHWSASDLEFFLETGMYPDGDFVGDSMAEVIDGNTALLTAEDRKAIVAYLRDLPIHPDAAE